MSQALERRAAAARNGPRSEGPEFDGTSVLVASSVAKMYPLVICYIAIENGNF